MIELGSVPKSQLWRFRRNEDYTVEPWLHSTLYKVHTDKKEIKCNEDSEILQEVVRDTTRNSSCFSEFCVVSRTISCSISESLLHFSFFLTLQAADYTYYLHCALCSIQVITRAVWLCSRFQFRPLYRVQSTELYSTLQSLNNWMEQSADDLIV